MTDSTDPIAQLVEAVRTVWEEEGRTEQSSASVRLEVVGDAGEAAADAVRTVLSELERRDPAGRGPTPTAQGVRGYRDLQPDEVELINWVKYREDDLARAWGKVERLAAADPRWLNIARTHFREGFSAMVRAIAQPYDPFAAAFADNQQAEAEQAIPRRTGQ